MAGSKANRRVPIAVEHFLFFVKMTCHIFMNEQETKRVKILETREGAPGIPPFKKVRIVYSDGSLYYNGWIQDFGDRRTGPTFFESNYKQFQLERERVKRLPRFWQPLNLKKAVIEVRDAVSADLDNIIDLRFQNYFDGGYDRISAYQALSYEMTETTYTAVLTVDGDIMGYTYYDLAENRRPGEAYFDSLFCAPAVRGKGLADQLIASFLETIRSKGFSMVSGIIIGSPEKCDYNVKVLGRHGFEVVDVTDDGMTGRNVYILKQF